MTTVAVAVEQLRVTFDAPSRQLTWCVNDVRWAMPASQLWAFGHAGDIISAQSPQVQFVDVTYDHTRPGTIIAVMQFWESVLHLRIFWHLQVYTGTTLAESWLRLENAGSTPCTITRLDAASIDIPSASYDMLSYTGTWGSEFEPMRQRLAGNVRLETRAGRSSQGMHPWCAMWRENRSLISFSVAWSGNWLIRCEELPDGAYRVSAGPNDWAFFVDLAPQASVESPKVVVVALDTPDLNLAAQAYAQVGRGYWYPRTALADRLPVEWNHWWTYEDRTLNETVFRANVDVAKGLGIEVCTLDAGWFGPADPDTHWYDYRGDWHLVNTRRFPSGIRALADYVHAAGMAFGIWCEIEAVGRMASVNATHPHIVARRHEAALGYVCLGSPAGWEWAFATLDRIITEYAADWIKLDFNLDPGAGCDRTDHGHGAGDGLLCHYHGYYRLLDAICAKHPHVVLENCSSGGLRIDLGLARHTHMAFLSDPDWPEHSLQLFWGAATMLAPDALLHWGFCEWGFADHPQQTFDPRANTLTVSQLDYYTRISMLRRFGFSQGLPDLPAWVAARYAQHIHDYQHTVRRFVSDATLYLLTNQPRRDGTLERYAAFQYVRAAANESLLAIFRMPGAKKARRIPVLNVDVSATYRIEWLGDNRQRIVPGSELRDGLWCDDLSEPGAALLHITIAGADA